MSQYVLLGYSALVLYFLMCTLFVWQEVEYRRQYYWAPKVWDPYWVYIFWPVLLLIRFRKRKPK